MAKQKDQGDTLEIYYDQVRDNARKFQKILRKVILSERKNLLIDMHQAPPVPRDYLNPLVLGAKALKAYGRKITITLSALNYSLLKNTPESVYFQFELVADTEGEEVAMPPAAHTEPSTIEFPDGFSIEDNRIILTDEILEYAPSLLPGLTEKILEKYEKIIIDISGLFLLTPSLIHTLILETINSGNAITVRIQHSMLEMLQSNLQAAILNLDVISETVEATPEEQNTTSNVAEKEIPEDAVEIEEMDDLEETARAIPTNIVSKTIPEESNPETIENKVDEEIPSNIETLANDVEAIAAADMEGMIDTDLDNDGSPSTFKLELNCLYAGEMTEAAFRRDLPKYLEELFQCGNLIFIDMTAYARVEREIARLLIKAHWLALDRNTKLIIKMQSEQKNIFSLSFPTIQEALPPNTTPPEFAIVGSRLELHNVSMPVFLDKFSDHFKTLLGTGSTNLVVDMSNVQEISDPAIEILVLSYLEAIGKGLTITFRIKAVLEEKFQKSNRSRSLPLEVVRAERTTVIDTSNKPKIDIKKIMGGHDSLSSKVLQKEFDAVHVESRGTFQNWEPAPVKADEKKVVYTGVERRVEKRYDCKETEVLFARGSIAKFSGRHYPVHNISQSGICFTSAVMLSRNEPIRVKIFKDDMSVEITGKVIWAKPIPSQALFKIGIQYTKITEVAKMQLRDILRKFF